jgi:hypothetical protein
MSLFDSLQNNLTKGLDSIKSRAESIAPKLFERFVSQISVGNSTTSNWDGLSPHLIASIFEVEPYEIGEGDRKTRKWRRVLGGRVVKAPFTEANLSLTPGWQSPFEGANSENVAPNLAAMLQSGQIQNVIDMAMDKVATENLRNRSTEYLRQFEGRTGLTKLNSVQTFSKMEPTDISGTLLFRAWNDGLQEVELPLEQLMLWSVPVHLCDDSALVNLVNQVKSATSQGENKDTNREVDAKVSALLPSEAPIKVGLTYKGRTYMPFVIESLEVPLTSPVNSSGHMIYASVNIRLCSLSAWDRRDVQNTRALTF